ncbi:retropepsin-like aspartic protease family protein [Sphingobium subterraneum]|uniref:Aspartyl protease family protein n=1 Tax=Sphingobium subterraneum TaxID=627688 RepID=A0A841J2N0_9SPHN|nr:TIGR02281 family clan AA aspartic protease [Sphingobium subterraneum]MBB6122571.1 aspartyl protease family protein [Sphingobium subterraneum]
MNAAQSADVIWYVLALVLVGSALLSRRFSLRSALGMVLSWIVIFGIALVIFSYRNELMGVASRVRSEVTGQSMQKVVGQTLRIAQAPDGHYWADAQINGTSTRFLIDSGATITAVGVEDAKRAGLNIDAFAPPMMMQTANGVVEARRSSIASLHVGPIQASDLGIVVSESLGDVNVLGMNFLSRLKSWRVENGEMVLEP